MKNAINSTLSPFLLWLMAISSGLVVANNYYSQPLLVQIAQEFRVDVSSVSKVPMLTQLGYAAGLLMIVPLGDMLKRRKLVLFDFVFILFSIIGIVVSRTIEWLYVFSFLIGFTSVIPQVFIPMVATWSEPAHRTRNIGFVMSGLLIGILASRIVSGWVGAEWGWRSIYYVAAALLSVIWILLLLKLPEIKPSYEGAYGQLLKSVWTLAKQEPVLQIASLRGAVAFAAFSAFWSILAFHLAGEPFRADSTVAGLFGALGMAGALMASLVGKLAAKISHHKLLSGLILIFMVAWFVFFGSGNTYLGLIFGVVVLDVAMQGIHILNQSSIFTLRPEANNRINTVYMTSYFIGGAMGTLLASLAWEVAAWRGVSIVGFLLASLILLIHHRSKRILPASEHKVNMEENVGMEQVEC